MRVPVLLALAVVGALAAGCSDASPGVTGSEAAAAPGPTPIPTVTGPLHVRLHRFPAGLAIIGLSPPAKELTVEIKVGGLAPGTTHAVRLMNGSCARPGTLVHPLRPLVIGADSIADVRSVVDGVTEPVIPDAGWYLAVDGDGTTPGRATPVMCGDITNSVQQTVVTTAIDALVPPGGPDPGAAGVATLRAAGGRLSVEFDLTGLTPGSLHGAQLRRGNCEGEAGVLHPLTGLIADAHGHAEGTTVIPGIDRFPLGQWFVGVSAPGSLEPVLCGNVSL